MCSIKQELRTNRVLKKSKHFYFSEKNVENIFKLSHIILSFCYCVTFLLFHSGDKIISVPYYVYT